MTSFQNPPFALRIRSCIEQEGEAKTKGLKGERKGKRLDEGLKKEGRETNKEENKDFDKDGKGFVEDRVTASSNSTQIEIPQ